MKRKFNYAATIFLVISITLLASSLSVQTEQPGKKPDKKYIPDIGTFMKIGFAGSPSISMSTGEIFFTSSMSGVSQVYRLTENGWPYQLSVFDDGIGWYNLSYDGKQAIVGASVGGSEDFQLFLMDTGTGQIRQLTERPDVRYGSIYWKKDGSGFYFKANSENPRDYKIYYFDLSSGTERKILDTEGSNGISHISLDEKYMITWHAYSNISVDLFLVNLESGQSEIITSGKEDVLYLSPHLMPDNKTIYLICNDNEDGVLKRAILNLDDGEIEFLEPESKWTVDQIVFSDNFRYMAWLENEDGFVKIKLHDWETNQPIPAPPLDGIVESPVLTDDGRLVFRFACPTKPPDVWIWDWNNKDLSKVTHSIYAGIDPDLFVEPRLIRYKSFDSLEIPAFLYLPPDYQGQPVPFVIHAHGGPEGQFQPYFQRHFTYLLLHGYGILAPNVRGSKGYGSEYLNLDNYTNRLNSIKDYKAAADFLIESGFTEKGMIGIKGTSYGGYVTLACITEYPDLFSAAVDHVGIANFVTFLKNTRDYRRHIRESEYGPLTDEEFLESISPIHKAALIKTPLLVIHGENDPRVPVSEARQIIKAVLDNNGIVDSLIFPDEGHGVSKLANRLAFYRRMAEFFNTYLKN
jgi:dipeptidyl aminopeptidase/acylaminoacyl peptidase